MPVRIGESRLPRRARTAFGAAGAATATPSRNMGLRVGVDIDKALTLAAADEDAETLRKLALRELGCST